VVVERQECAPADGVREREGADVDDEAVSGALRAPTNGPESIAQAALAAIRDVSTEAGRLVRIAATRIADHTPVAPLVRAVLGEPALLSHGHRDAGGLDGDTWAARVADAEQALAIGVQRTTELHERYERALVELREARQREQALQAEVAATIERSCAEREAISRRADELVATAEAQRAGAVRDAEATRAALAAAQHASLAQRNELALARSEAARLARTAEDAVQAREGTARDLATTRARLAEAQERLRALEVELARIGEEHRRAERATLGELSEREARWQDEISSLRLEHARERDRANGLAEETARLRVEAEVRERREQRLQEELRAIAARADADREETVRRAQDMVQAAEGARAAVTAELEALRGSLSTDRARLVQIEAAHEKVEQGVAEREAALETARTTITQLEAARATLATEFERTRSRLTETERELLATQHEHGLAQRQLDRLCTAHDDLIEDHARVSTFLEETRANEKLLRAQVADLQEHVRTCEGERTRLLALERERAARDASAAASAKPKGHDTELASLRAWVRTLESELADVRAGLEQAAGRERRLQDALDASAQTEREHQETLAEAQALARSLEAERATLVAELEETRTAMASAQRVIMEAEEETRTARAEAERLALAHEAALAEKERLRAALPSRPGATEPLAKDEATKASPAKPAPPVAFVPSDTRIVAVLDTTSDWQTVGGIDVRVVAPGEGIAGRIGEIGPGRCIVNLAAPGAITTATELRVSGVAVPLWGAIVVEGGERGLSLGQIEVLSRPIDPDLVRSQCATIAPKNARILAIGSDSSTFIALRQGLMKAGMSVSIAWDLKQATELMEIVRPHMVVLDLALPGRGAAALVAELARLEVTPVLVLLPGTAEQVAAFSSALGAFVPVQGARNQQNLLRAVIDAKRDAAATTG
jgi:chromosome segregation ATPase